MRGLSGQKACIAVGIDARENAVATAIGRGKPSSKRVPAGPSGHMSPGSLTIHGKEKARDALIGESSCESGAHRADARDPVCLRVKRDEEKRPKTERVVRHLMMHDLGNRRSETV